MSSLKSEPQSPSKAGSNSSSGLYSLDGRGGGPSDGVRRHSFLIPYRQIEW